MDSCDVNVIDTTEVKNVIDGILSDEDARQDAWVEVLDKQVTNESAVADIAREIRRKRANQAIATSHRQRSLSEPLGHTENFTLEDVIPAEETGERDYPQRLKQPKHQKGVVLDGDVRGILKQRFPNLTYRNAIRRLVGVELVHQRNHIWQPWEDEVIRKVYPWGGSLAASLEIGDRSIGAIASRAWLLGVKFDVFRPKAEWLTVVEVARLLGIGKAKVWHLSREGKLKHVQLPHNGKILYFTPSSIGEFLSEHQWDYHPERVAKQYQSYIPASRSEWVTKREAAEQACCAVYTVWHYVYMGLVEGHRANNRLLVRVADVLKAKKICSDRVKLGLAVGRHQVGTRKLPYKVAEYNGLKHFIYRTESGDWYLRCKPHSSNRPFHRSPESVKALGLRLYPALQFVRGKPTCKVCLAVWGTLLKKST